MLRRPDRSACVPWGKGPPCDEDFVGRMARRRLRGNLQGPPSAMTGVWRWRARECGSSAWLGVRDGDLRIECPGKGRRNTLGRRLGMVVPCAVAVAIGELDAGLRESACAVMAPSGVIEVAMAVRMSSFPRRLRQPPPIRTRLAWSDRRTSPLRVLSILSPQRPAPTFFRRLRLCIAKQKSRLRPPSTSFQPVGCGSIASGLTTAIGSRWARP
jgi:hypothetical protein